MESHSFPLNVFLTGLKFHGEADTDQTELKRIKFSNEGIHS